MVVKNLLTNAGDVRDTRDVDLISGSGRAPGVGSDLLQYSCLENFMDRGTWWATVHEVAELDMTDNTGD